MIRLFLYSLLAIITGLLVTLVLARDPGYLLLSWGNSTFETSLFALFVALVLLLIVARLVYVLLSWLNPLNLVRAGRQWSAARAARQALNAQNDVEEQELELMHRLASLSEEPGTKVAALRRFWKRHTRGMTPGDELISACVQAYMRIGAMHDAVTMFETALESRWSATLVRRYSLLSLRVDDAQAVKQLQKAESWLGTRSEDGVLLLAAGRLALRASLWGKARDYFERSLRVSADVEAYAELARLLQNLKEQERDPRILATATRAMSAGLPQFPQPA